MRPLFQCISISLLEGLVEAFCHVGFLSVGYGEMKALALVPHIQNGPKTRILVSQALAGQRSEGLFLELVQYPLYFLLGLGVPSGNEGFPEIELYVRKENPQGREHAGHRRDQNLSDAEFPCKFCRMNGASTAKGKQGTIPGIDPFFYRRPSNTPQHVGIDHRAHAENGLLHTQDSRCCKWFKCLSGLVRVEANIGPQKGDWVENPGQKVCIGHSRQFPAPVVAGRTRLRTRALWAYA